MIALVDDSRPLHGAATRASHALAEHRRRAVPKKTERDDAAFGTATQRSSSLAPILIVVNTGAARLL
jgi:hypothetical protein